MRMMKTTTIALLTIVFACTATNARAELLAFGDLYYLGFVQGVTPELANPSDEAAMINTLITLAAGAGPVALHPPAAPDSTLYDRRSSGLPGPFQPADATGVSNVSGPYTGINVAGYAYIVGKYGGPNVGDFFWRVPAGTYDLPTTLSNPIDGVGPRGISHYALFNTSVPDGGMTLMLLGGALFGLEVLRRQRAS